MPTISAIIITKNEERYIKNCIESVLWTDEIVVLDSGSTDKTVEICKQYEPKVKIYETDWPGYGKQKNRAKELATSDWILSIDADEVASKELKNEILDAIKNNEYIAYKIPRLSYFKNRPIYYSLKRYSEKLVLLAKKDLCRFSENIVHESLIVKGKIGELKNIIRHYTYNNLENMINKMNNYSSLSALKSYQDKKKTSIISTLIRASWSFIKIYFIKLGFLNGWPGFLIAFNKFENTFYKHAKLLEGSDPDKRQ